MKNTKKCNDMKRVNIIMSLATVAVLLLWGCEVKDPIYQTDHPDKGVVTVTADWNMGAGITKPTGWKAFMNGQEATPENPDSQSFREPFAPGSYTLYAWNPAEQFAINGTTATVATEGSGIHARPDWLFTGRLQTTIEADKKQEVTVTMEQQVRQLTLVIEPTGGTADKIKEITGTLSGVAGSYDMESGEHRAASSVALTFTKDTDDKWKATVRLLGIVPGAGQKLNATITFTGGTPQDIPLDSDLSTKLEKFNDNKKDSLALEGEAVETQSPAGFTATIINWDTVYDSGIAN